MSGRYVPNPNAHITLDPCGREDCPVCNPIPAGPVADGVGEPKLTKPARVHHTEFAAGLPERMVIECAQRHYEWNREPWKLENQIHVWRERVEGYRNSGVDECYPMAREVEKCADDLSGVEYPDPAFGVALAVAYSRNFANSKPDIGATEKEHILGLCDLLARVGGAA